MITYLSRVEEDGSSYLGLILVGKRCHYITSENERSLHR